MTLTLIYSGASTTSLITLYGRDFPNPKGAKCAKGANPKGANGAKGAKGAKGANSKGANPKIPLLTS